MSGCTCRGSVSSWLCSGPVALVSMPARASAWTMASGPSRILHHAASRADRDSPGMRAESATDPMLGLVVLFATSGTTAPTGTPVAGRTWAEGSRRLGHRVRSGSRPSTLFVSAHGLSSLPIPPAIHGRRATPSRRHPAPHTSTAVPIRLRSASASIDQAVPQAVPYSITLHALGSAQDVPSGVVRLGQGPIPAAAAVQAGGHLQGFSQDVPRRRPKKSPCSRRG